jgi:hypothetical protein
MSEAAMIAKAGPDKFGYTQRNEITQSSDVYIENFIVAPAFYWAALHEMFHTLGAKHTQAGTVEYYWWGDNVSYTITCADQQQYYALRGVDIHCAVPYILTGQ